MGILDVSALSNVLKIQYPSKEIAKLGYKKFPLLSMLKMTDFKGKFEAVPVRSRNGQNRGADIGVALAKTDSNSYEQYAVTRVSDYSIATVSGEAIAVSSGSDASVIQGAVEDAMDGAIFTLKRSMATDLFGNGGGAKGQISAGSSVGTTAITLSDITQAVNFDVGMVLNLGSTDGTSGSKRAGTVQLTSVNRQTGVLTASGNWTTGIAAAAAGDFIFEYGDFESANRKLVGLAGWVPATDPTSTLFFGVDRSSDPSRLGGLRFLTGAGGPIEDTLTDAATALAVEGGEADTCIMNPRDFANLVKQQVGKVIFDKATSMQDPELGFEAISLGCALGKLKIVADPFCPKGKSWILNMSDWELAVAGKTAPTVLAEDGNEWRASTTADSYITRLGYYGNLICRNTRNQCYVAL